MLLSNYQKWRNACDTYVAIGGTVIRDTLGMKNVSGSTTNIMITSNNNGTNYPVMNLNRQFSNGIGVMLSDTNTEGYDENTYVLGNNLNSWCSNLAVQYSSYSEDGKLVRVFTVSATNIINSVSLKAVGITKPFYYDASTSAQFLMGIYIPETPIELTAGEGFSFAFKWTEE